MKAVLYKYWNFNGENSLLPGSKKHTFSDLAST